MKNNQELALEYAKEHGLLNEVEEGLESYIATLREKQSALKEEMDEFLSNSWGEGEAFESFISFWDDYYAEYSEKIQRLEVSLEITISERKEIQSLLDGLLMMGPKI